MKTEKKIKNQNKTNKLFWFRGFGLAPHHCWQIEDSNEENYEPKLAPDR